MGLTQLELLYDFEPKRLEYIDRKIQITKKKVIIFAPPKSGVTYLIYSHLINYDKDSYLYIDFNDARVVAKALKSNLQNFIIEKNIKLLVLENFDFSFDIPKCDETIISTNKYQKLNGFELINFYPLDFEEYIAFDKTHSKIENIFNAFANRGTYPQIALSGEINKIKHLQHLSNLITKNEKQLIILKTLSLYQAQSISLYQIFNKLKSDIKISKDLFYGLVDDLKSRQIILFLEKYDHSKAGKKLFLIDFALKNALNFEKDFLKRLENIVFLELYKRNKNLYYTDEIDFYLPKENSAILVIPFLPPVLLKNKILKRKKQFKKLNIKKVEIISLGNEDEFEDDNIKYEIIPFWNWASLLN